MAFLWGLREVLPADVNAGLIMNAIDTVVRCFVLAALVVFGTMVVRNVTRALTDVVGGPALVTASVTR
jgi:hypothetical protein